MTQQEANKDPNVILLDDDELIKCFKTIIEGKEVVLTVPIAETIIKSELEIKNVSGEILKVLIEILPFYMQHWPGWSRLKEYTSGNMSFTTWHEKFRQFLLYKLVTVIKNERKYWDIASKSRDKVKVDKACETENPSSKVVKPTSPYGIVLSGSPAVVSNLVFMSANNNVVVKQHQDKPWEDLNMIEFLNWPCIGFQIVLPNICITRENNYEYHRYVSLSGDSSIDVENTYIDSIVETATQHEVIEYKILHQYIKDFTNILRCLGETYSERAKEISIALYQFLNDVSSVALHQKTICTNARVSYNMGKSKFIRNKKMISTDEVAYPQVQSAVNFYEIIIPRIQFTLNYFSAEVEGNTFKSIVEYWRLLRVDRNSPKLKEFEAMIKGNCIKYNCLLCKTTYVGPRARQEALAHLEKDHKNEQSLLCYGCRTILNIKSLASNRWSHNCKQ